jgi:flagellar biosynthetic protein FliR
MIEGLAPLVELWQAQAVVAGLVFLRIGAMMALLPAFGERSVPARIRLGITLMFTVLVAPAVLDRYPEIDTMDTLLALAGLEVLAGLAIGILLRLMMLVLQMAGTIAANSTSLAQIFGGSAADPQPAMSHILVIAGLALAAMSGLHVKLVLAMISSFDLFPPGQRIDTEALASWGTERVGHAFALSFTLAAPFIIASVIYNLALGAINRAMPQLMVAFVGAPAITFAGLVIMLLSAPLILAVWLRALDETLITLGVR